MPSSSSASAPIPTFGRRCANTLRGAASSRTPTLRWCGRRLGGTGMRARLPFWCVPVGWPRRLATTCGRTAAPNPPHLPRGWYAPAAKPSTFLAPLSHPPPPVLSPRALPLPPLRGRPGLTPPPRPMAGGRRGLGFREVRTVGGGYLAPRGRVPLGHVLLLPRLGTPRLAGKRSRVHLRTGSQSRVRSLK